MSSEHVKYSTEQFDKNVLFIASGGLGGSFAFIKDIIPNINEAQCKYLLMASWYTFASIIFLSLVCHYISIQAGHWAIRNDKLEAEDFNPKIKRWNFPIRTINIANIIAILGASICLIIFIHKNI